MVTGRTLQRVILLRVHVRLVAGLVHLPHVAVSLWKPVGEAACTLMCLFFCTHCLTLHAYKPPNPIYILRVIVHSVLEPQCIPFIMELQFYYDFTPLFFKHYLLVTSLSITVLVYASLCYYFSVSNLIISDLSCLCSSICAIVSLYRKHLQLQCRCASHLKVQVSTRFILK